ncbi:hypothetical protein [uncultured Roseobacter sp.]|uniref:hypothetical protein n=1 Tax=uncultured Roseobacter sp. TaxID=114847 RepID=UPI00260F831E|nr:hypothetical protein [uncultured Roseobacter sp.]
MPHQAGSDPQTTPGLVAGDIDGVLSEIKAHSAAAGSLLNAAPWAIRPRRGPAAPLRLREALALPPRPTPREEHVDRPAPDREQPLADWIAARAGAEEIPYDAATEGLVLVWDDSAPSADPPQITLSPVPGQPERVRIALNGEAVAEIPDAADLRAEDIVLLPLSKAVSVGLEEV